MDPSQEDNATAIFDVTHQCLDSFDRVQAKHSESIPTHSFFLGDASATSERQHHSSCDSLGILNSFWNWVDSTDALSLKDSSLDARLRGSAGVSTMVIELLEIILRNLQCVDRKPEDPSILSFDPTPSDPKARQAFLSKWENSLRAIRSTLDHLHFVDATIRKLSATRLDLMVTTFLTDEDRAFRSDSASLVRYRYPAARKGLCQQLGDAIAVRRQILLRNKRHLGRLAVRRVPENVPSTKQRQSPHLEVLPGIIHQFKDGLAHHPTVVASSIAKASRSDPQVPALGGSQLSKQVLTTATSTITATLEEYFEYPLEATMCEGETRVQCPFCLIHLELGESNELRRISWRRHIDEHLKPYGCLFPECSKSLVFFVHRHEWEDHMESAHSKDWLRKVHTTLWFCDVDHASPEIFENELQWRRHMQNLRNHPNRDLPTQLQLDCLSTRSRKLFWRDKFVCPLCEQIPNEVRDLLENGEGKPTVMYNLVVRHVANHLQSLSLLAVPPVENNPQETPGTFGESVRMSDSCVSQPPSGRGRVDGASLPPETWSFLDRDRIASLTMPGPGSSRDKEYLDYTPPEDPPEPSEQGWVDRWNLWKNENDAFSQHCFEADPILAHFNKTVGPVQDLRK
ncbi:hypothetical protein BGZ61DRAFT_471993 [Ilyonectria robusta]|uniref:uncharacterized protein n=1 Tax=Ilyonectria robusta TaxID=1079257 RepID=UPI001E8DDCD8|nr:uncharacterized protein BGZ61DRAFT_471993 [Ilyonectria robusta]KAH8735575.1 hypothetical protein BGZ61DRAFT_471993 [Ilyonectria robusta]